MSHCECDRGYVAFRRRYGLCRIEKVTGPMSPSHSRGRLCFRRFRFPLYCTRGTCASSLVRSHTSRSPGARHLRACPGVCRLLEGDMAYVAFPSRRPRRSLTDITGVLCVSTALAVSGERDKLAVAFTFSNSEI
ncbi:hypothetical protein Taro_003944 [Colocasia esculenta]|uniref:Uncharacterized protein n=1 Tax=Colocasia esculenta TaxID=4460 RepID=A0A843TIM2_COLES|nr:hypothetical protein [Colocasia esculenta]